MELVNASLDFLNIRKTDDFALNQADRLSSKWMGIVIAVCLVLSTTEAYVGRPLECWPNDEIDSHPNFILEYCYLNNTRYVYPGDKTHEAKKSKPITYYQWTNLILISLLGIYFTPRLILLSVIRNFDISPQKLAETSIKYNISAKKELRDNCISEITSSILSYLSFHTTNSLTYTYLSIKLLNVLFNIGAILFLCAVFGKGYLFFSIKFLFQVMTTGKLENDVFPLETYCDFRIIVANDLQEATQFTVACLLSVNLFSIFIYATINFIQLIVLTCVLIDFFATIQLLSHKGRESFIRQHLKGTPYSYNFTNVMELLSLDGVLVLKLLSSNVNMVVVSEVFKKICLVNDRTQLQKMPEQDTDVEQGDLALNGAGGDVQN